MLGYSLAILSLAASTQAATWGYIPGVDGNNLFVSEWIRIKFFLKSLIGKTRPKVFQESVVTSKKRNPEFTNSPIHEFKVLKYVF